MILHFLLFHLFMDGFFIRHLFIGDFFLLFRLVQVVRDFLSLLITYYLHPLGLLHLGREMHPITFRVTYWSNRVQSRSSSQRMKVVPIQEWIAQ